jgi:serine/threonine protein kinase
MNTPSRSEFERCALASGLLTRQQLDEAARALRWSVGEQPDVDSSPTGRQLAENLVETGAINAWQATQLLAGHTRFTLGPYRIIDSLGQGGMGQVFRAEHAVLERTVAVKVLPRQSCTPEAIAAFTREIRAQARLDHENLVQAFDAGHDGNVYYLVSEYVPGADLRKLVRENGPLGMQTAASIISQVARGLDHAHRQGLIHRDVKPGNVLVTPEGHAKLSDLGLAGPLEADAENDPRFGKIVGTADYVSPDHIKAPWAPTPAWDIYSLGCTCYYAVTSKVPFPGGSTADKARAHCDLRPLDPRCLNPALSAEFVDVIADMMAKDPAERIQKALDVVDRLTPWVGEPMPIPLAQKDQAQAATPVSIPTTVGRLAGPASQNLADTADNLPGIHQPVSNVAQPPSAVHADVAQPPSAVHVMSDVAQPPSAVHAPLAVHVDSQQSQVTHPVAAAGEETHSTLSIPDREPQLDLPVAIFRPVVVLVLFPLAMMAATLLAWMVFKVIF